MEEWLANHMRMKKTMLSTTFFSISKTPQESMDVKSWARIFRDYESERAQGSSGEMFVLTEARADLR